MKKRLYFDMDGTTARFHDEAKYLERMYEREFFLNLKPFHTVVDAIRIIANENKDDIELFALSSCITEVSKVEKAMWLKAFLPEVPESNYIFVDVGVNKAMCLNRPLSEEDFLLDDYNLNLRDWRNAGGTSIKLVNNINDKGVYGPRWDGERVYEADEAYVIAGMLKTIIL